MGRSARIRWRDQDDVELVTAAQGGDTGALDALLNRHYDRFFALCRRLCGNPGDGADATQEALIALVRGLHSFDGRARFSTWSHRVVTNACLDEIRRRGRRPQPIEVDDDYHLATTRGPDDAATARLDVERALAQLPLDWRAAVVLRDLCGLDYAEIAEVLDIPPGTVRSRIARGRGRLAEVIGNPEADSRRPTPSP